MFRCVCKYCVAPDVLSAGLGYLRRPMGVWGLAQQWSSWLGWWSTSGWSGSLLLESQCPTPGTGTVKDELKRKRPERTGMESILPHRDLVATTGSFLARPRHLSTRFKNNCINSVHLKRQTSRNPLKSCSYSQWGKSSIITWLTSDKEEEDTPSLSVSFTQTSAMRQESPDRINSFGPDLNWTLLNIQKLLSQPLHCTQLEIYTNTQTHLHRTLQLWSADRACVDLHPRKEDIQLTRYRE